MNPTSQIRKILLSIEDKNHLYLLIKDVLNHSTDINQSAQEITFLLSDTLEHRVNNCLLNLEQQEDPMSKPLKGTFKRVG